MLGATLEDFGDKRAPRSQHFDGEIRGQFDGNLTVRQKLVIYSTGKVTGRIRYGKVVIEEGGQLSGEVEVGTAATRAAQPTGR